MSSGKGREVRWIYVAAACVKEMVIILGLYIYTSKVSCVKIKFLGVMSSSPMYSNERPSKAV